MAKKQNMNKLTRWLSRKVDEGTEGVVQFQKMCGIKFISQKPNVQFEITNFFLYRLFSFGSSLGEVFFF